MVEVQARFVLLELDDAMLEDSLAKALVKFVGGKTKCYQKCNANIARSKIPAGSCDPESERSDDRGLRVGCEGRPSEGHGRRIDKACFTAPATHPSCLTFQPGAEWASEVESLVDPLISEVNCGSPSGAFLD
jgi:hypothetical protein